LLLYIGNKNSIAQQQLFGICNFAVTLSLRGLGLIFAISVFNALFFIRERLQNSKTLLPQLAGRNFACPFLESQTAHSENRALTCCNVRVT
jgi:hypothetical protein